MTYNEAIKAGLGDLIVKPGEKIKKLSEITDEEFATIRFQIPEDIKDSINKWGYDENGKLVMLYK